MPTVETLRSAADLAIEVARLPDEANVGWETAALIINAVAPPSRRTLERWRQGRRKGARASDPDLGPPFTPGVGLTSPASYNVGQLRNWLKGRSASSTMEVSARRGLTFSTLEVTLRMEPWVFEGDSVLGHVHTVDATDLHRALLGTEGMRVESASLAHVLTAVAWRDADAREPFRNAFVKVAEEVLGAVDARGLAGDLDAALPQPDGEGSEPPSLEQCPKCGRSAHAGRCRI